MNQWPLMLVDINNVFLNGYQTEEVYMHQQENFMNQSISNHVCKLREALYGL